MRLRALRWILRIVIAVGLTACREAGSPLPEPSDVSPFYREPTAPARATPTPTDRITVTFWTDDNEPERVAVYRDVAARFMQSHNDIDLRIVPVDESTLTARLATAVEADTMPDLLRVGVERLAPLAAAELLDPLAAQAVINAVGEADFLESPLEMVRDPHSQRPLAVPYDGWIQAVWYRVDAFDELDLPAPNNWSTLQASACRLSASGHFEHGLVLPTDPGQNYVHQVFEQVAISNNGWPFDESGIPTMNSPQMVEALRWFAELQACAPPGPQTAGDALSTYLYDRTGMIFYSTYLMDDLVMGPDSRGLRRPVVDDLAAKTGAAATLEGPAATVTYGQVVALAFTREASPAARLVAEFFLTDGYLEILALDPTGKVPVRRSALQNWQQSGDVFRHYPDATLAALTEGYDSIQRWFLRADYDLKQRAVIGDIEGELLIPQAIYALAVEKSLSPQAAANRLQMQVEALLAARSEGD